jgi:hypothetical protein
VVEEKFDRLERWTGEAVGSIEVNSPVEVSWAVNMECPEGLEFELKVVGRVGGYIHNSWKMAGVL